MASIKFDGVEILNTTYTPRYIKHETAPLRDLALLELAREDGSVLVSDRYGTKRITVAGTLVGSSQEDLESKIDSFKELFGRSGERDLDIEWGGTTRRYKAVCVSHEFDRDRIHLNIVPWTAEFIVPSGEGKEITETTALDELLVDTSDPDNPGTGYFDLWGGKPPKPRIRIDVGGTSVVHGLEFKNTDNGEKLIVTWDASEIWDIGDWVEIRCDEKRVIKKIQTISGIETHFYGVFPQFRIGRNNFSLVAGGIVNQGIEWTNFLPRGISLTNDTTYIAQSFEVPYEDNTFQGISLFLTKIGSPTGDITVEIQTDDGGKPSGSVVSGASWTITASDISTAGVYEWVTKYTSSMFSLSANTKYWIVIKASGVDASNYYAIGITTRDEYVKGNYARSTDGGTNWTDYEDRDVIFKLRFGGRAAGGGHKVTVTYYKTFL